jgi:hypothetical protein
MKIREVPEEIRKASDVVDTAVRTNTAVVAIVGLVSVVALLVALAALNGVKRI